jgi:hypothetical protein
VADDALRPALQRLAVSTKDVGQAQKLLGLALDISKASGKDLESVANALGRAQDGNTTSLGRLGLGLSKAELATLSFTEIQTKLSDLYGGAAAANAKTFQGQMDRLKVAFDEGKETIGVFILQAITPMVENIVGKVVPALSSFIDGVGGTGGLKSVFDAYVDAAKKIFIPIFEGIKSAFDNIKNAIMNNKDEFIVLFNFLKNYVAPFFGGALKIAIQGIGIAITVVVNAVAALIKGFEAIVGFGARIGGAIGGAIGLLNFGGGRAMGGPVSAGTAYMVGEQGPELFVPRGSGTIVPNGASGGSTINLTVNGAIDPISTARQIANILNIEATNSGSFNALGVSRAYLV